MEPLVVEVTGESIDAIAPQIPATATLGPGARVVVRTKSRGLLAKLIPHAMPSAAIGSALLARGYVEIAAGEEAGRACVRASAPLTAPSAAP